MNIGINGGEFLVLILIAFLVLGPERLPEYTKTFTDWLRTLKQKADGAKEQFKEETGKDFDEIEWRKYDPRQYDPRRMIREALREPVDSTRTTARQGVRAEDLHGGLSRQDLVDMDPRSVFRKAPAGSASATAASGSAASAASAAGVAAGGAAAALMGSGQAEAMVHETASAPSAGRPEPDPDPLDLLGKAPAPFDVDAT